MANYLRWKLVGGKCTLKKGVLPRFFECQGRLKPVNKNTVLDKLNRQKLVDELIKESEIEKELERKKIDEWCQANAVTFGIFQLETGQIIKINDSKNAGTVLVQGYEAEFKDASVQVSKVAKHRSKQSQTLFNLKDDLNAKTAVDPINISCFRIKYSNVRIKKNVVTAQGLNKPVIFSMQDNSRHFLGLDEDSFFLIRMLMKQSCKLTTLDIFLTLRKIKLNETFDFLKNSFHLMSVSIARQIFFKTCEIVSKLMKDFIFFPDANGNSEITNVIKYLEFEIEPTGRLNCVFPACQSTVKFLISATADDFIHFVSQGYGDDDYLHILKDCGVVETLKENSCVLFESIENEDNVINLLSTKQSTISSLNSKPYFLSINSKLDDFFMISDKYVECWLIWRLHHVIAIVCGIINFQQILTLQMLNEKL